MGTPTPLTYWMLHATRLMMSAAGIEHVLVQAIRLEQLREDWKTFREEGKTSAIFFADSPESAIVNLFKSLQVPIILVREPPADAAPYVMGARDMTIEHTFRFVSQSLATLSQLKDASCIDVFGSEAFELSVEDFVARIAGFLDFPASLDRERVYAELRAPAPEAARIGDLVVATHPPHARWPGQYELAVTEKADSWKRLLEDYRPLAIGEPMRSVVWPAHVFSDWDRPGGFIQGWLPMVGRHRFLVCGPYLQLPKGQWVGRVKFEVAENFSGNRLYSDILANGEVISGIVAPLPKSGLFSYELEFAVTDPYLALEVRMEVREGAIEGALNLIEVEMRQV